MDKKVKNFNNFKLHGKNLQDMVYDKKPWLYWELERTSKIRNEYCKKNFVLCHEFLSLIKLFNHLGLSISSTGIILKKKNIFIKAINSLIYIVQVAKYGFYSTKFGKN